MRGERTKGLLWCLGKMICEKSGIQWTAGNWGIGGGYR